MNKIKKYTVMQKMFDVEKNLIENISDPKTLIKTLKRYYADGLEYIKEKNSDAFQYSNRLYQVTIDRMKALNVNTQDYPNTLEALMN
jgi:hypothetical protein